MNVNIVTIAGRLTRDPELRYLTSGAAVLDFSLGLNRKWKTEQGEEREEVLFADHTAFGKTAETIAQYCKKGDCILCEGRLKQDVWEDKQTGAKRSKIKVVVERFHFGTKAKGNQDSGDGSAPAPRSQRPKAQPGRAAPAAGAGTSDTTPQEDDDVPF